MKTLPTLLLLFFCLALRPVTTPSWAQDGCGCGCTEIEVGEDDDDDEDDEAEKQRKKNAGLAGGGKGGKGDAFAPKVKMSLQQKINKAIKAGVKWLKQRQDKDGSWGPVLANRKYGEKKASGERMRDPTGPTSFAMYALAKCGVKRSDEAIKKGLAWLHGKARPANKNGKPGAPKQWGAGKAWDVTADKRHYTSTTYESAAVIMMLEAIHTGSAKNTRKHKKRLEGSVSKPPLGSKFPKKDWKWMHERVVWLTRGISRIKGTQNRNGGWRYGQRNGDQDLSSTQFVLLALRAASQAGYPVEKTAPETWRWAANYCERMQKKSGAFGYGKVDPKWSGSMDACGIASLVICKEQMALAKQPVPDFIDDSIKKGLAHLDTVFDATQNPNKRRHLYYYLYGVERVGDLTGRAEFNGKNWYVRGARLLVGAQDPSGKWVDSGAFKPKDVLGTCFALLFLKRATPPTVTGSEK